ncbi:MAG: ATP-binding cassette domain-containing protein [Deltaproteobacteria bacterium]|jgi:ABC-type multidrug transport system ATPase subunit|nr:ATP-binding cassette domain-containing protein [Deltaproteobacteria bacterium]
MTFLRARDVRKSFGEKLVLENVTRDFPAGKITLLSGPSGIGKSTILEILAGMTKPDGGRVERFGKVSVALQDNAIIPWLTAAGNLSFVVPKGTPPAERERAIADKLNFFELDGRSLPGELSGGMLRRLCLARAFLFPRPILLLDEPFAFLDERWHRAISGLMKKSAEEGAIVVMSGHSENEALRETAPGLEVTIEIDRSPVIVRD